MSGTIKVGDLVRVSGMLGIVKERKGDQLKVDLDTDERLWFDDWSCTSLTNKRDYLARSRLIHKQLATRSENIRKMSASSSGKK